MTQFSRVAILLKSDRLRPGVVSVFETAETAKKYFGIIYLFSKISGFLTLPAVSSGTLAVHADNTVQIIAEEAVPVEQLDLTVCPLFFND